MREAIRYAQRIMAGKQAVGATPVSPYGFQASTVSIIALYCGKQISPAPGM